MYPVGYKITNIQEGPFHLSSNISTKRIVNRSRKADNCTYRYLIGGIDFSYIRLEVTQVFMSDLIISL